MTVAIVETYECDQCGKRSNGTGPMNWFVVAAERGVPVVVVYPMSAVFESGARPARESESHFCTVECAARAVQTALQRLLAKTLVEAT